MPSSRVAAVLARRRRAGSPRCRQTRAVRKAVRAQRRAGRAHARRVEGRGNGLRRRARVPLDPTANGDEGAGRKRPSRPVARDRVHASHYPAEKRERGWLFERSSGGGISGPCSPTSSTRAIGSRGVRRCMRPASPASPIPCGPTIAAASRWTPTTARSRSWTTARSGRPSLGGRDDGRRAGHDRGAWRQPHGRRERTDVVDVTLFVVDEDEQSELECKPSPYAKLESLGGNVPLLYELYDEWIKQIETGASELPRSKKRLKRARSGRCGLLHRRLTLAPSYGLGFSRLTSLMCPMRRRRERRWPRPIGRAASPRAVRGEPQRVTKKPASKSAPMTYGKRIFTARTVVATAGLRDGIADGFGHGPVTLSRPQPSVALCRAVCRRRAQQGFHRARRSVERGVDRKDHAPRPRRAASPWMCPR